jgi:hypothetical protein
MFTSDVRQTLHFVGSRFSNKLTESGERTKQEVLLVFGAIVDTCSNLVCCPLHLVADMDA